MAINSGYVGERSRKKRRSFLILIFLIIIVILAIYGAPSLKLNENVLTNNILPNEKEIQSPIINNTIEDLELDLFDKKQKIIFRNRQIELLKNENKALLKESKNFNIKINELNDKLKSISENDNDNLKIKKDHEKELKKLDKMIKNLKKEKVKIFNDKNDLIISKDILQKEYEFLKNINLDFDKKIRELEKIINEQNLVIEILKDTSPHG